jgi:hypothetical protein
VIRVQVVARIAVTSVAISVVFLVPCALAKKPKPIKGKLDEAGLTVMALDARGEASLDVADRGRFRLTPPARRVTLHLRGVDGIYAGPIVVGREKKKAIVGVEAGAKLGATQVSERKGYAKVKGGLPEKAVDDSIRARARNGVPIGAGVFGRVRSKNARGGVPGDSDLDGIPEPLDVDDDGDLVLDNLDPRTRARAMRTADQAAGFGFFSRLTAGVANAVNANAPGASGQPMSDAEIAARFPELSDLLISIVPAPPDSAELDCAGDPLADPPRAGLRYCSAGGPGRVPPYPGLTPGKFPEDFDGDGDGFGTLHSDGNIAPGSPPGGAMTLRHGAVPRDPGLDPSVAQIGTGDTMVEHVTTGADESRCPLPRGQQDPACTSYTAALQYVFATTPTLIEFSDETATTTVPYPVAGSNPGPPGPGTRENPFPVADGPDADQDVELTLTFWRPQRRPIEGEKCPEPDGPPCPPDEWIEIGGLVWTVQIQEMGLACRQDRFSENDDNLSPATGPIFAPGGGLTDGAPAVPTSPQSRLTYTLNVTQCLADHGISFNPGEARTLSFLSVAQGSPDNAQQSVFFKRQ